MHICFSLFFFFNRTLANHCHNIEQLDLSECNKITDISTESISRHCSKLASINLESCSNITDNSLKYVSDGCPVSLNLLFNFSFFTKTIQNCEISIVIEYNYHRFFLYYYFFLFILILYILFQILFLLHYS